ncbi:MAG: hypothetical protein H7Y07_01085 [Pyrinomonadaceae bacterium]|nr:hypothetical protein [Sphingobacteriaceae bacterium]
MKKNIKYYLLMAVLIVTVLVQGCSKEEDYKPMPFATYLLSDLTPAGTTTSNSASGRKTVSKVIARVFVNQPVDKPVTVTYAYSGTAVQGQDYNPVTPLTVTVPASTYYAPIEFTVINNPALTSNKTVIITLKSATDGFDLGLGTNKTFKTYTYTIQP